MLKSCHICFSFQNLGIQCVKKKDLKESISLRISRKINPFNGEWKSAGSLGRVMEFCCPVLPLLLCWSFIYFFSPKKNLSERQSSPSVSLPVSLPSHHMMNLFGQLPFFFLLSFCNSQQQSELLLGQKELDSSRNLSWKLLQVSWELDFPSFGSDESKRLN